MSLTPIQRANLIWASRPPGPAPLWHAVGSAVRSLGGAIDALGVAIQGDCAHHERLPIPCTAVKVGADAAPAVGAASFVAPSASVLGAVTMDSGASTWCPYAPPLIQIRPLPFPPCPLNAAVGPPAPQCFILCCPHFRYGSVLHGDKGAVKIGELRCPHLPALGFTVSAQNLPNKRCPVPSQRGE